MAYTDREHIKKQQAGSFDSLGLSDRDAAVAALHTRSHHIFKSGTENAATNVAETAGFVLNRKAKVTSIKLLTATTVANDASDYDKIYVYKRTSAGASQTLLGSWNTATAAQGAITANIPAELDLVDNSDLVVDAGSVITYHVGKFSSGKVLALATITVDTEER
jgi:hypothetical protein